MSLSNERFAIYALAFFALCSVLQLEQANGGIFDFLRSSDSEDKGIAFCNGFPDQASCEGQSTVIGKWRYTCECGGRPANQNLGAQ